MIYNKMDEAGKLPSTFHNLKYGDLQKWAKKFGIKANLKAQKLVEALMQHIADDKLLVDSCQKNSDTPSGKYENRKDKGEKNEYGGKIVSQIILLNDVEESGDVASSKRKFEGIELDVIGEYSNNGMVDDTQEKDITESNHVDQEKEFLMTEASNGSIVGTDMTSDWLCRKESNIFTVDKKCILSDAINANSVLVDSTSVAFDSKTYAAVRKTHIPRLDQLSQNRGSAIKPFTTQYWAKLHQRQFDQMDSLDVYMKKKTKRALALLSPNMPKSTILKGFRTDSQKDDVAEAVKDPHTFVPTVFTTAKMNINFSELQKTQHSSLDTHLQGKAMIKCLPSPNMKHSAFGSIRKSLGTPFAAAPSSAGNTTSSLKPKFDLQASLARPITWKPHIGKLKETYVRNLRYNVKKVQVKSRDDRRKEVNDARSIKRDEKRCSQRGISDNQ